MIKLIDILNEIILSNLTDIEPYNDPNDEYAQDLDADLEDQGIDWRKESQIQLLDPNNIKPSEWNYLDDNPDSPKVIKYSKLDPKVFPPVLVVKKDSNEYEVIDGIHRVHAFRLNNYLIPAIVMTSRLEQGLSTTDSQMVNFMYNKYRNTNIPTPVQNIK